MVNLQPSCGDVGDVSLLGLPVYHINVFAKIRQWLYWIPGKQSQVSEGTMGLPAFLMMQWTSSTTAAIMLFHRVARSRNWGTGDETLGIWMNLAEFRHEQPWYLCNLWFDVCWPSICQWNLHVYQFSKIACTWCMFDLNSIWLRLKHLVILQTPVFSWSIKLCKLGNPFAMRLSRSSGPRWCRIGYNPMDHHWLTGW